MMFSKGELYGQLKELIKKRSSNFCAVATALVEILGTARYGI